jgi:hypothetical protein
VYRPMPARCVTADWISTQTLMAGDYPIGGRRLQGGV